MIFSMKTLRIAAIAACTMGMGFGLSACRSMDKGKDMSGAELSKPTENIVQIATGSNMGDVSTLVTLVKQAGLVDTLSGPGPFTVFAPTNEAFDNFKKADPTTYAYLNKAENKDKLAQVLTYHVVPGNHPSNEVVTMTADTADGIQKLMVNKDSTGGVTVSNGKGTTATVIKADIKASNGVIHWVDTVLVPPDMVK
jgi:uncharacterized surface protein with fasciclin (FAS1) repeats